MSLNISYLFAVRVVLNFSVQLFTSERVYLCALQTHLTHFLILELFRCKFFKMFCIDNHVSIE